MLSNWLHKLYSVKNAYGPPQQINKYFKERKSTGQDFHVRLLDCKPAENLCDRPLWITWKWLCIVLYCTLYSYGDQLWRHKTTFLLMQKKKSWMTHSIYSRVMKHIPHTWEKDESSCDCWIITVKIVFLQVGNYHRRKLFGTSQYHMTDARCWLAPPGPIRVIFENAGVLLWDASFPKVSSRPNQQCVKYRANQIRLLFNG